MTAPRIALAAAAGVTAFLLFSAPAWSACKPIASANDLNKIRNDLDGKFCLTANIDLASVSNFTPIGPSAAFEGTLDGRGHAIRNLTSTKGGLFDNMAGATIKRLTISGAKVKVGSTAIVGLLAGVARDSTIEKVSVRGSLTVGGSSFAGGLVGIIYDSVVSRCIASVKVKGSDSVLGGAIGMMEDTTISQCYSTGDVTVEDGYNAGVGGLVGQMGEVGDLIKDSFATGDVSVTGNFTYVGGLVGLAGFSSNPQSRVKNSYSVGRVTVAGSENNVGGLTGRGTADQVTKSYWDKETSGQTTSAGGKGLKTATLKAKLPSGFKSTIWSIDPGVSYPYLSALRKP